MAGKRDGQHFSFLLGLSAHRGTTGQSAACPSEALSSAFPRRMLVVPACLLEGRNRWSAFVRGTGCLGLGLRVCSREGLGGSFEHFV